MNVYLRELLTSIVVGLMVGLSLSGGKAWLGALSLILALASAIWFLSLNLRRRRDVYYLIPLTLTLGGIDLAAITLPAGPTGILAGVLSALILYLLLRSLVSRRFEPKADVPLHQNAFLGSVWIGSFLAIYGLFELAASQHVSLGLPILGGGFIAFLLSQALAFFFLIPPWEFRRDSVVAALIVGEAIGITSIWVTTPFFTAALSMVLLYLFWGLAYHTRKGLLTRRLIYEYGVISVGLVAFLLITNRWIGST